MLSLSSSPLGVKCSVEVRSRTSTGPLRFDECRTSFYHIPISKVFYCVYVNKVAENTPYHL